MALSYVDPNGGTFIIPAAYPSVTVAPSNSGLATTGVLVLVGEAESGPVFSAESDLSANSFGPDQAASVASKYKSGNLVDAFNAACGAVVDPDIGGSFSRAIMVKTNTPVKATSNLTKINSGGVFAVMQDEAGGRLGNLLYYTITNPTAEAFPTTGSFTFIPPSTTTTIDIRINGAAAVSQSITAFMTPAAFVAAVNVLTSGTFHVASSGGVDRGAIVAAGNVTLGNVSGNTCTFTFDTGPIAASVAVGDTFQILTGAFTTNNTGSYVITAIDTARTIISATKLADGSAIANGTVTPPTGTGALAFSSTTMKAYSPVIITLEVIAANNMVDGQGKSLEITDTGTSSFSFYQLGTVTKVTWLGSTSSPNVLTAVSEYSVSVNVFRSSDSVQETNVAGGEVLLKIGYKGTTAQIVVSALQIVATVTGGTGTGWTINKADYPTVNDMCGYISSQTGWSAAAGNLSVGGLPTSALDLGTFLCGSSSGAQVGRVKDDLYRFKATMVNSGYVELGVITAVAGLPAAVATNTFLSGGAKGATTQASYQAAIDALAKLRANFVIPLFSRDATYDIIDGLTDASSTYTIAAINAYTKSHVHAMSGIKTRRNRQAFLSYRGAFSGATDASSNTASYRCAMTFEDYKASGASGIVQYQPWYGAVLAAATQAGAFYKSILRKAVNVTGLVQGAGDWTYNSDSDMENALKAGLLPAKKDDQGAGFYWVSDQTTYGKDGNSVYNSIQMVYCADTVALTTAYRMERAFVGKSVADVSAAIALSYLEGIMADFFRLRLIASSDDAPRGYKNAKIEIQGPVMKVSLEIKLAGAIYFIPISFYVTEIKQTAQ